MKVDIGDVQLEHLKDPFGAFLNKLKYSLLNLFGPAEHLNSLDSVLLDFALPSFVVK